jgi:hypothetical protein
MVRVALLTIMTAKYKRISAYFTVRHLQPAEHPNINSMYDRSEVDSTMKARQICFDSTSFEMIVDKWHQPINH